MEAFTWKIIASSKDGVKYFFYFFIISQKGKAEKISIPACNLFFSHFSPGIRSFFPWINHGLTTD